MMKVYAVITGYADYEGGGDTVYAIFDSFDKAETFVLNKIATDDDWKLYNHRTDTNTWEDCSNDVSSNYCRIEIHAVL